MKLRRQLKPIATYRPGAREFHHWEWIEEWYFMGRSRATRMRVHPHGRMIEYELAGGYCLDSLVPDPPPDPLTKEEKILAQVLARAKALSW